VIRAAKSSESPGSLPSCNIISISLREASPIASLYALANSAATMGCSASSSGDSSGTTGRAGGVGGSSRGSNSSMCAIICVVAMPGAVTTASPSCWHSAFNRPGSSGKGSWEKPRQRCSQPPRRKEMFAAASNRGSS